MFADRCVSSRRTRQCYRLKTAELDARRVLLDFSRSRLSLPLSTCLTVALAGGRSGRAGGRAVGREASNRSTVPAYRNHLSIDRCAIVATRRRRARNDRHPGDDDGDERAAAASSPSRRRRYRNINNTTRCLAPCIRDWGVIEPGDGTGPRRRSTSGSKKNILVPMERNPQRKFTIDRKREAEKLQATVCDLRRPAKIWLGQ